MGVPTSVHESEPSFNRVKKVRKKPKRKGNEDKDCEQSEDTSSANNRLLEKIDAAPDSAFKNCSTVEVGKAESFVGATDLVKKNEEQQPSNHNTAKDKVTCHEDGSGKDISNIGYVTPNLVQEKKGKKKRKKRRKPLEVNNINGDPLQGESMKNIQSEVDPTCVSMLEPKAAQSHLEVCGTEEKNEGKDQTSDHGASKSKDAEHEDGSGMCILEPILNQEKKVGKRRKRKRNENKDCEQSEGTSLDNNHLLEEIDSAPDSASKNCSTLEVEKAVSSVMVTDLIKMNEEEQPSNHNTAKDKDTCHEDGSSKDISDIGCITTNLVQKKKGNKKRKKRRKSLEVNIVNGDPLQAVSTKNIQYEADPTCVSMLEPKAAESHLEVCGTEEKNEGKDQTSDHDASIPKDAEHEVCSGICILGAGSNAEPSLVQKKKRRRKRRKPGNCLSDNINGDSLQDESTKNSHSEVDLTCVSMLEPKAAHSHLEVCGPEEKNEGKGQTSDHDASKLKDAEHEDGSGMCILGAGSHAEPSVVWKKKMRRKKRKLGNGLNGNDKGSEHTRDISSGVCNISKIDLTPESALKKNSNLEQKMLQFHFEAMHLEKEIDSKDTGHEDGTGTHNLETVSHVGPSLGKKKKKRNKRKRNRESGCDLSGGACVVNNIVTGIDPTDESSAKVELKSEEKKNGNEQCSKPNDLKSKDTDCEGGSQMSIVDAVGDTKPSLAQKKRRRKKQKTVSILEEKVEGKVQTGDHNTSRSNDQDPVNEGVTMKSEEGVAHILADIIATKNADFINKENIISQIPSSSGASSCTKKKLLILDVNGLLVDFVPYLPDGYKPDITISRKSVFKRPFCDDFIKFCFERFEVGIWSSRIRNNLDMVVHFLMRDTRDRLLFCWDQSHCTRTRFFTIENKNKPLFLKELKKLWEKLKPNLPWENGDYNETNTLLLDDTPYKALRNPANTAIFPHPYQYTDKDDVSLGPGGALRSYLEGLALSENVQKYVEENPFGQLPITESDPSWNFYRNIMLGN